MKLIKRLSMLLVLVLALGCFSGMALAEGFDYIDLQGDGTEENVDRNFSQNVLKLYLSKYAGEKYQVEGGNSVTGEVLFGNASGTTEDSSIEEALRSDLYNSLEVTSRDKLLNHLKETSDQVLLDNSNKGNFFTNATLTKFWQNVSNKYNLGSNFINSLTNDIKPDLTGARQGLSKVTKVVNSVLGYIAIIIMFAISITMILDIAYITIPFFQGVIGNDGTASGGNGNKRSFKFVSDDAINAGSNKGGGGSNGEGKNPLLVYFKSRILALIILGICLMYLINGQIYAFVGSILDMIGGFLGF